MRRPKRRERSGLPGRLSASSLLFIEAGIDRETHRQRRDVERRRGAARYAGIAGVSCSGPPTTGSHRDQRHRNGMLMAKIAIRRVLCARSYLAIAGLGRRGIVHGGGNRSSCPIVAIRGTRRDRLSWVRSCRSLSRLWLAQDVPGTGGETEVSMEPLRRHFFNTNRRHWR